MNEIKRSSPIFNETQANFYLSNGCIAVFFGRRYSNKTFRYDWCLQFKDDDVYRMCKEIWMSNKR